MELIYPRQRSTAHSVLGKWTPSTTTGWAAYRTWAAVGALVVALLYPAVLAGFATRFYTRRINRTAASIGLLGVVGVSMLAWGSLTAVAHFRFSTQGFVAVLAAGVVATVAAAAAVLFARIDGRATTVAFAYPAAMTGLFLPPVVAALYSPTLGAIVFPGSTEIAIWLLDNVLAVAGLDQALRARFTLSGIAYVGMWFAIAVPLGWALGLLVTLADAVRPTPGETPTA